MAWRVAVVGATGNAGREMLKTLDALLSGDRRNCAGLREIGRRRGVLRRR